MVAANIDYMTSGCTCVAVYMVNKKIYIASVGDSRTVLGTMSNGVVTAKELTRDHKPDNPKEEERIKACGGFVKPPAEAGLSARVYLDSSFTMIGLAMSRSLGGCFHILAVAKLSNC